MSFSTQQDSRMVAQEKMKYYIELSTPVGFLAGYHIIFDSHQDYFEGKYKELLGSAVEYETVDESANFSGVIKDIFISEEGVPVLFAESDSDKRSLTFGLKQKALDMLLEKVKR